MMPNYPLRKPIGKGNGQHRLLDNGKPSMIPRLKTFHREIPVKETSKTTVPTTHEPLLVTRNVQHVHHLNVNHAILTEHQATPILGDSGRPIPTLGLIYREGLMNYDAFNDWFFESTNHYPEISEVPGNIPMPNDNNGDQNVAENTESTTVAPSYSRLMAHSPERSFKTTEENLRDWLSSRLEHPTRDVSGHQPNANKLSAETISKHNGIPPLDETPMKVPQQDNNKVNVQNDQPNDNQNIIDSQQPVSETRKVSSNVTEKTTVVLNKADDSIPRITKMNTDIKPFKRHKTDIHQPMKFPSTPNPPKKDITRSYRVPSYVDYPSEVLQRTTNFEGEVFASFTASGREPGQHDDVPSRGMLECMDEYSTSSGPDSDWFHFHSSRGSVNWRSSHEDPVWRSRYRRKYKLSNHDYYYHYCWRKEVAKQKAIGEDKRFIDHRGKAGARPFRNLHKGISIGRICRHRWNRVWKKTTERLANWSKSPSKFRKSRILDYLQGSTILDHADVQTTIFAYNERGTDAEAKEQKSAEITTSLRLSPGMSFHKKNDAGISPSARLTKFGFKHVNIGPSLYHFMQNSASTLKREFDVQNQSSILPPLPPFFHQNSELSEKNPQTTMEPEKLCLQSEERSTVTSDNVLTKDNKSTLNIHTLRLAITEPQNICTQTLLSYFNTDTFNVQVADMYSESTSVNLESFERDKIDADTSNVSQTGDQQSIAMITSNDHFIENFPQLFDKNTSNMAQTKDPQSGATVMTSVEYFNENTPTLLDKHTSNVSPDMKDPQPSAAVMTSLEYFNENASSLFNKEIQVTPVCSIKKLSASTSVFDLLFQDTKSSTVTETNVPCRRLDKTLVTSKGTVLSCTGTKIMSVSSVCIQTGSVISYFPKTNAVDIAVSAHMINTRSNDCVTTPSVCRYELKDSSTGADEISITDKATVYQCLDAHGNSVTVSAANLKNFASFSGGSHHMQKSFNGDIRPECTSACISTRDVPIRTSSVDCNKKPGGNVNKMDCYAQYSSSTASSDITENSQHLARIGRSKLMTVRMLSNSVSEIATQAQPLNNNMETKTISNAIVSVAVSTSGDGFHDKNCSGILKSRRTSFVDTSDPMPTAYAPTSAEKGTKSNLSVSSSRDRNFIISSNINATKWMKGCPKEGDIDMQSILNLSHLTVTESLEKTSIAVTRCKIPTTEEKVRDVTTSKNTAVNCVRMKAIAAVSTTSIHKIPTEKEIPQKDKADVSEIVVKDIVKRIATDAILPEKDIEASLPQTSNLCDTATNCVFTVLNRNKKSACAFTSRHVLPSTVPCCKANNASETDCLFVYEKPRCVVHKCCTNVSVQMQPQQSDFGNKLEDINLTKNKLSSRSIGLTTSVDQESCNPHDDLVGEVLPPKVYKALYETTKSLLKDKVTKAKQKSVVIQTTPYPPVCIIRHRETTPKTSNFVTGMTSCALDSSSCTSEGVNENIDSHLTNSCGYYSNLLAKKLARVTKNFMKQLTPSIEEISSQRTISKFYVEACTMKPSARKDENCQTKINTPTLTKQQLCALCPAISVTDIRNSRDKQDLKTVYYILTAIEGRVRRLKNNLQA